eukprot:1157825-Pelagomonas_calceolata.AAC.3
MDLPRLKQEKMQESLLPPNGFTSTWNGKAGLAGQHVNEAVGHQHGNAKQLVHMIMSPRHEGIYME